MTFALNFMNLWEIDITPSESSSTWARLAAGISSADPSNNENIDQSTYLNGDGFGSSDVIGAQRTFAFTGHRDTDDIAQNYIASIENELGDARKSTLRLTKADGSIISKECTIANVDFGGGDAAAKEDVSFEIHLNGKPEKTARSAASALSSVVAAGEAVGTTKFTATPGTGNSLSYKLSAASVGTIYGGQYVSGDIGYTSADDIEAAAGQFLQMYELTEHDRVASFLEEELESGDIKA